jgi:hypothetical protein
VSGYVYLIVEYDKIEEDKNPVKIGVTTGTIENRIKKLQTGNASELYVLRYFKSEKPFMLEKMLHLHYHNRRTNGEWFNLTDQEVLSFNSICQEKENIIKLLYENNYYFFNPS